MTSCSLSYGTDFRCCLPLVCCFLANVAKALPCRCIVSYKNMAIMVCAMSETDVVVINWCSWRPCQVVTMSLLNLSICHRVTTCNSHSVQYSAGLSQFCHIGHWQRRAHSSAQNATKSLAEGMDRTKMGDNNRGQATRENGIGQNTGRAFCLLSPHLTD